jgi:hypothetical protein
MNSRRLIYCPQLEDCTLPHRGRKYGVVHHSKFGGQCRSWVNLGPSGDGHDTTALTP